MSALSCSRLLYAHLCALQCHLRSHPFARQYQHIAALLWTLRLYTGDTNAWLSLLSVCFDTVMVHLYAQLLASRKPSHC